MTDSNTPPTPPLGWQAPLIDVVVAGLRNWLTIAIVVSAGLTIGVARYLLTSPYYRAECVAVLMPREKSALDVQITHGAIETTRDVASRASTAQGLLPANVELYEALARSRSVMDRIGERFRIPMGLADDAPAEVVFEQFRESVSISGTETGMLSVTATAPSGELSAEIANALVHELVEASKSIEKQLVGGQIRWLGPAVDKAASDLRVAEGALGSFEEQHKIVDLDRQSGEAMSLLRETELRRQGLIRQRIERLRSYAPNEAGVIALDQQIQSVDLELQRLRERSLVDAGDRSTSTIRLEHDRLEAEVKNRGDLLATLKAQLDLLDLRADEPGGSIAVLKPALPPAHRAGPGKKATIGAAVLIALILGIVLAVLTDQWRGARRHPYVEEKTREVRERLRGLSTRRAPVSPQSAQSTPSESPLEVP